MSKLKTLKDIEAISYLADGHVIYSRVLKQEAIKWVKDFENKGKLIGAEGIERHGILWFIKHFFNITKEDLSQGMTQEVPK